MNRARLVASLGLSMVFAAGTAPAQAPDSASLAKLQPPVRALSAVRRVADDPERDHKDPALAAILSFILPGAGQVYAGRVGTGLAVLLGVGATAWRGGSCLARERVGSSSVCEFPPFGYLLVSAGIYLWGIVSAPDMARSYNHGQR